MTPQEALQAMKFYKEKLYNGIFNDKIGAFDVAISALEKQIPKKTAPKTSKGYEVPVCGKCNGIMDLMQGDLNYCPNCGQALDWSDTK